MTIASEHSVRVRSEEDLLWQAIESAGARLVPMVEMSGLLERASG